MSTVAYLGVGVTSNHGRGDVSARLSFSGWTRLGKAGGVAACVVRGWWGRAWLVRGWPLWEVRATGYHNGENGSETAVKGIADEETVTKCKRLDSVV